MFNRSAKCCSLKLNFDGSGINSSLFQNTKRFASKSLFIDEKVISVSSGRGGDGKIAFAKDKWHQFGPASGGNGGIGASIYLVASKRITTLNGLNSKYLGVNGKEGDIRVMHGANAKDVEIMVPIGTTVNEVFRDGCSTSDNTHDIGFFSKSNESFGESSSEKNLNNSNDGEKGINEEIPAESLNSEQLEKLAEKRIQEGKERQDALIKKWFKFSDKYYPQQDRIDMLLERIPPPRYPHPIQKVDLLTDGQKYLLTLGGSGGLGNPHFVSPLVLGPRVAGRGEAGVTRHIQLELKTLADLGLIGLPNAGKSTLLAAVSNAHPRIAPYPFTTLNPYVGTIDFPDFYRMTLADIPGLIKGAHLNLGLGHRFLKHVERNHVLVYVVDLASTAPWEDLEILENELEMHLPGLTLRPSVVVANKADVGQVARDNLEILKQKTSKVIVPVSAKNRKNIETLTAVMRTMVQGVRERMEADAKDK